MKTFTKKKFNAEKPFESLPFCKDYEISGYIDNTTIFYKRGTKLNCDSFSDKQFVFHTHVDIQPTNNQITLPDIPSPIDILVFLVSGNKKMLLKTPRLFITLTKTKYTDRIERKALRCMVENDVIWSNMVKNKQYEKMFYYVVHYLKRNIDKKNKIWNLSWKRIAEQIFKIDVKIQHSTIKERL